MLLLWNDKATVIWIEAQLLMISSMAVLFRELPEKPCLRGLFPAYHYLTRRIAVHLHCQIQFHLLGRWGDCYACLSSVFVLSQLNRPEITTKGNSGIFLSHYNHPGNDGAIPNRSPKTELQSVLFTSILSVSEHRHVCLVYFRIFYDKIMLLCFYDTNIHCS